MGESNDNANVENSYCKTIKSFSNFLSGKEKDFIFLPNFLYISLSLDIWHLLSLEYN